ncbi:YopX family protein [Streptococcus parasanguinis]|uniref:YopX family protein n=1 Tax=Streptococcus parasanguinis TaxID=1318 RepID=UPI00319DE6AD
MIPKFRAWDKETQTMLDVSLIDFKKSVLVGEHWEFGETNFINFDDVNLMKSTGLFDKNGKEIFEKDILDYNGRKVIVKWHGTYASFIYEFVDELQNRKTEWKPLYLSYYHFKIIGNVYQNPGLLELEVEE